MRVKTFIERPVLSIVISVAIMLLGVISLCGLPVEQFPNIAPPTVEVMTSYPGASAGTVEKSVIVPLEEAINGVEDMTYISSTSSNAGDAYLTVFFKQGTDPDMAAVNVQNRVSTAAGLLPAEVTKVGVTTTKQQKSMLKTITLYSPDDTYDTQFLNNYLAINVIPRLKRISGVGAVTLLGSNYSMRLWLKPDVMGQYGLVPADVTAALAAQNIESATGSFGENHGGTFQYTMKYRGRLSTPEEFGGIVIKSLPTGEVLRLRDVARVELGDEAYNYRSQTNGHPGALLMVYQTAGSNATEVIKAIDAEIDNMARSLPKGVEFGDVFSTKDFLDASMHQVLKTLFEAFFLVVLIVFVFLQDVRSVVIPAVSIIVSLVGTFIVMLLIGFSINLLTLFALVLAIGIVVDDAIIVVEAVQARFDIGYRSPFMATADAMDSITSAIITTTLVFMAVFLPVSMMGGTSGTFYTQFGLTMAAAVGISAVNALTLSPALCALMLRPHSRGGGFAGRYRACFNAAFAHLTHRYVRGVIFCVRRRPVMWAALVLSTVLLALLMSTTRTGLVPDEDTGSIMVNVTTPPGSSVARTNEIMRQIERRVDSIPEVEFYSETVGYGLIGGAGPSSGMLIVKLRNWSERKGAGSDAQSVVDRINAIGMDIPDVSIFAFLPPLIDGYGVSSGFEINLQDQAGGRADSLYAVGQRLMAALRERPEISAAYSTFNVSFPQYNVEVDPVKCVRAGITADAVLETLSDYYSGAYVSNFNRFSKLYRVMIQASPEYRVDTESLDRIMTRTPSGMAPLSSFVTISKDYGPESVSRFNLYSSMGINGEAAPGYSSGDAIRAVRETAGRVLPKGYGYEFSGISREESGTSNNTVLIFLFCFAFVYLILCGLYESFLLPFSVLLSVPFGLMGSFLFARMMGLENNIYLQTGLIMLIGLLSKTAILVTGYAVDRRKAGMTLTQAAVGAAKARFRPILMTVLAMIFGLLPLMFSSGAGANGNSSLGTGVVGGLIVGALALLFFVPALFIVFQTLQERIHPVQFGVGSFPDLQIVAE
ncbi:MAG: efflux RND transporter permease subunit [Prevotellaceae bacterium]|nr:efflux RND transporter permease subunit [Prevotellaceae bacterium]